MKRFERLKQILEEAVEGKAIMAHGNFWRDLTLEQFKVKKIYGKQLVETGNAEESNLVKALEGRAPFGANIGTPGAIFKRMPDGFPPVAPEKIAVIRKWIDDGCPDEEETPVGGEGESQAQRFVRYNAYWRDFDNWSLFNRTPEIDDAINEFFPLAEVWMAVASKQKPLSDWENAISPQSVRNAVDLLASRILETIRSHYGTPINFDELFESYELFGADKLPDDPLRPNAPRHNMNSEIMWFFYSAFVDAAFRLNAVADKAELEKLSRGILIGMLNDGLFRGRFPVKGFTPDEEGAAAVRAFARAIASTDIQAELARRFVDSQAPPPVAVVPGDNKIVELMNVPAVNHDLNWLKESLQAALKLELSTIPPYLCACWSIDNEKPNADYPIESIKAIVFEEMQHMGLVCNMMTTLSFTPEINTPDAVPKYPGPLPGGVNPELTVSLRKFSKTQLETFLEIEKPEHPPIMPVEVLGEEFPTIGAFYDAISDAFEKLAPSAFKNDRQITAAGLFRIDNLAKVEKAIKIIKRQGEGTETSPEDEENVSDLAHYYRFRELYSGRKFIKNAAGQWVNGEEIPFPTVYEMADIPEGGYAESRDFDVQYTLLLNSLQKTWETGDDNELTNNAVGLMFTLEDEARTLMKKPLDQNDPGKGCFGPSFLLITGV